MRSNLVFDYSLDYGKATPAIHQVVAEWAAVDWLVAPRDDLAEARAKRLLSSHNTLARAYAPEWFSTTPKYRTVFGGWPEFSALCAQVQTVSNWDWKFSALKKLCYKHSKAHGWQLKDQAKYAVQIESGPLRANGLFGKVPGHIMWMFTPRLDVTLALAASPPDQWDSLQPNLGLANWYISYANMDACHCLEWQLAEESPTLDDNPFLPLMRCYAEGFLPFGLGPEELVLFAFRRAPMD